MSARAKQVLRKAHCELLNGRILGLEPEYEKDEFGKWWARYKLESHLPLSTDARRIERILGRIEHGIVS